MIRYKTDILTIMLCGNRKPDLLCDLADMRLIIISHRHQGTGKLILCQIVKCVGLILRRCNGIADRIAAIRQLHDTRIVSCGNIIRTNLQ